MLRHPRPYGIGAWAVLYRELLRQAGRQSSPERETSPVSQPVAPCADFSGAVEQALDKQASGRIWAVFEGDLPCVETIPNRLAFAYDLVAG
ncbi:MAG: hypothetical protein ACLR23_14500 [Clostridia bacterium]